MRETSIRKHPLDEVLAQAGIVEPPFLFDRQPRKARHQGVRKQPASGFQGHPARAVHLDAFEAAGGRVLLQHEATELGIGQLLEPAARVAAHAGRLILCRLVGDQANLRPCLHQPERFARGRHAGLDFRAHRHPLDEGSQRLDQERIPFVAAVEAHAFSEQAGRNAETDGFAVHRRPVRRLHDAHAADSRAASASGVVRASHHGSLNRVRWDPFFTSNIWNNPACRSRNAASQ